MIDQQHQHQNDVSRSELSTMLGRIWQVGEDLRDLYLPRAMKNLKSWLARLRDSIADWTQERLLELRKLGEQRASKLVDLVDLDQLTCNRIASKVAAAERSLEIRSSWIRAVDRLPDRFPAVFMVLGIVYVAIGWAIYHWVGDGAPAPQILSLVILVLLLLVASLIVIGLIRMVLGPVVELLARVLLPVGLASAGRNPHWWQEPLDRWLQESNLASWVTGLDGSINNALGIVAAFYTGIVLNRLLFLAAQVLGPRESHRDLVCATLLSNFLDVALELQKVAPGSGVTAQRHANAEGVRSTVGPDDGESDVGAEAVQKFALETARTGLRLYVADADRTWLVKDLESLARFTERQWRRVIQTGDHAADLDLDRVAAGIAARIRHWKTAAALGGPELERMRKAFSAAVVNIADEDWKAMAAEVSDRDLFSRKLVRVLRRVVALMVLLGPWAVLITKPFNWVTAVHESGMAPGPRQSR